jgi:hypothetical protein
MNKPLKKTASAEFQSSVVSVYNNSKKYKLTKTNVEANLKVSFKKGVTDEQIAETNIDIIRSFLSYLSNSHPLQFYTLQFSLKTVNKDGKNSESASIISTLGYNATGEVIPPKTGGGPHKDVIVNSKTIFTGLSDSSRQTIQSFEGNKKNIK